MLRPAIRRGRNAIEDNERKDVILLHFSRQPDGDLRCNNATDVLAKRSWTVFRYGNCECCSFEANDFLTR